MTDEKDTAQSEEALLELLPNMLDVMSLVARKIRPLAAQDVKLWRLALRAVTGYLEAQLQRLLQTPEGQHWFQPARLTCLQEEFLLPPSAWDWEAFPGLSAYKANRIAELCLATQGEDDMDCFWGCDYDADPDAEPEEEGEAEPGPASGPASNGNGRPYAASCPPPEDGPEVL